MSGSSLNHLSYKGADEIMTAEHDLVLAVDYIEQIAPGSPAHIEAKKVLVDMRKYRDDLHERLANLSDIFWCIEQWKSGDYDRQAAEQACTRFAEKSEERSMENVQSADSVDARRGN